VLEDAVHPLKSWQLREEGLDSAGQGAPPYSGATHDLV